MNILDELQQYIIEEVVPVPEATSIGTNGTTSIGSNVVNSYKSAVKDCGEYDTVDQALDRVFDALNKIKLSPAVDGKEWLGAIKGEPVVDVGTVLTLDLVDQTTNKLIDNASVVIELFLTTEGTYELTSHIAEK